VHRTGDRAQATFVVIDAGRVVDVQKQSLPAGVDTIQIGGKMVDLGSCPTR